jgi:hypothetical protein
MCKNIVPEHTCDEHSVLVVKPCVVPEHTCDEHSVLVVKPCVTSWLEMTDVYLYIWVHTI